MRPTLPALLLALALAACVHDDRQIQVYLQQARQAVAAHEQPEAIASINSAETLWRQRNAAYGNATQILNQPEALLAMRRARQAVQLGQWDDAQHYLATALDDPSTLTPGL